jgi:hypothetical protein
MGAACGQGHDGSPEYTRPRGGRKALTGASTDRLGRRSRRGSVGRGLSAGPS